MDGFFAPTEREGSEGMVGYSCCLKRFLFHGWNRCFQLQVRTYLPVIYWRLENNSVTYGKTMEFIFTLKKSINQVIKDPFLWPCPQHTSQSTLFLYATWNKRLEAMGDTVPLFQNQNFTAVSSRNDPSSLWKKLCFQRVMGVPKGTCLEDWAGNAAWKWLVEKPSNFGDSKSLIPNGSKWGWISDEFHNFSMKPVPSNTSM